MYLMNEEKKKMGNVSSVNGKTTRFVATETKYQ